MALSVSHRRYSSPNFGIPAANHERLTVGANQKNGARTVGRRRIQRVVDAKITVRFERNADSAGAALHKGSCGLTGATSQRKSNPESPRAPLTPSLVVSGPRRSSSGAPAACANRRPFTEAGAAHILRPPSARRRVRVRGEPTCHPSARAGWDPRRRSSRHGKARTLSCQRPLPRYSQSRAHCLRRY
jgi:hypothetical protein